MKEKLNVAVIGLGGRGLPILGIAILAHEDVRVIGVCDTYRDRADAGAQKVIDAGQPAPFVTTNYKDIIKLPDLDLVFILTSWDNHINIACECMEAGVYSCMEVGGAYSLDDCWKLVRTHERTGVHCMLLENCCYGRNEMLVLNMVRQGLFGEIVHCQGGYRHDLRNEISTGRECRHYRFDNYLNRNGENYPTHEIGPIANVLDINRGNRMVALNSVASKSAGLHEYIMREKGPDYDASSMKFAQGDVVTTIIRCAHGETIVITLDTTLPRPYSRGFHIQGTKAMYTEDNASLFIDTEDNKFDFNWKEQWGNVEKYYEKYDHPIWKKYIKDGIKGSHDGMDWLVYRAAMDSAKANTAPPIDVYDAAAWMSLTALSEQSILAGGAPVAIPDFTNGAWMHREKWNG